MARVREELLQMDEEVKRRRKEREQQAVEQRLAAERAHKMEHDNKHLLANLFNQKPMLNQSLAQSQKQKPSQSALQRAPPGSELQRLQASLQQNVPLLSLQRNPGPTQQRTHGGWHGNPGAVPNTASIRSNFSQFYPQSFSSHFQQMKSPSLPLRPTAPSLGASANNPLDEILDLTASSPSPSPDSTEVGLSLDGLAGHSAAYGVEDFNLESLIAQAAPNAQRAALTQQPLLLQQNHNLLTSNHHQELFDLLDLPLSPQMSTQKASPSSSTSSCSSSASSTSNSLAAHVPAGLLASSGLPPTSSSSSLFSSPSSSSSLFSNSSPCFSNYVLPQSDSLPLPNGHPAALDVREALNSMLHGPDRGSVIKYRPQD